LPGARGTVIEGAGGLGLMRVEERKRRLLGAAACSSPPPPTSFFLSRPPNPSTPRLPFAPPRRRPGATRWMDREVAASGGCFSSRGERGGARAARPHAPSSTRASTWPIARAAPS
jgi:hypothetical protein